MAKVEKSIDVNVPVRAAYDQWTQFETFPRFMDAVEEVKQIDDTHLHWKASIDGKVEEWDAEITEQTPDQRIAWQSTSGPRNAGAVTFHRLDGDQCRIMLQLEAEPRNLTERVGDALGFLDRQLEGDLERFKDFIENRQGQATGAWRGEVDQSSER
jgi:uncharacterized membrane protein